MDKLKRFKKFEIKGDKIRGGGTSCADMCRSIGNGDVWLNCIRFCDAYPE